MNPQEQKDAAFTLLNQLMDNPKTRRAVQLAVKEVNPKASIPEIDAAIPVMGEMKKLQDQVTELRGELMKRDVVDERRGKHGNLKDQGYSSEGIEKIEKLMGERGLTDYEAGAALFDRMNPAPSPSAPSYSGNRFMGDTNTEDFKKFMGNTDAWVDEETGKALADFRAGRA